MSHSLHKIRMNAIIWAVLLMLVSPPDSGAEPEVTNSIGMQFSRIIRGSFMMGSPQTENNRNDSEARHLVVISKDFYMQTTEVTLGQWRAVMGSGFFGMRKGDDDLPVTKVSWFDTQKFIEKLNRRNDGHYRLPTEAEWEYAARAGSQSAYPWGEEIDCSRANYANNPLKSDDCVPAVRARGLPVGQPVPVGQYPPNAWWLYDMAGNVWEWVSDWYGPYDPGQRVDPQGPDSGTQRVKRGGSWFKYDHFCRSANRASGHPASRYRTTGFRLVRTDTTK